MELTRSIRNAFRWNKLVENHKDYSDLGREELCMNEKLLLILLGSLETQKFSGAVKLVKAIFLAQSEAHHKRITGNFNYKFYRWDYGPFDSAIYKDLENLRAKNLITVSQDYSPYLEKTYCVSEKGKEELKRFSLEVDNNLSKIISKWAKKVNEMKRDEVLKLVYDKSNVKSYEMGDAVALPNVD